MHKMNIFVCFYFRAARLVREMRENKTTANISAFTVHNCRITYSEIIGFATMARLRMLKSQDYFLKILFAWFVDSMQFFNPI